MLRWDRWPVVLLCFAAGCATAEYDREWENALSRPGITPDELPHLEGRVEGPWVSTTPSDLSTSTTRTPLSVNFSPGSSAVHDRLLAEPGRVWLMTWPEGEVVPTTPFDESLVSGSIILTPNTPLEDRWYAMRVEVDGPVLGTSFVDGVQMTRCRPDSYPVVRHAIAADRAGQRIIDLRFSERVANGVACGDWPISDDEGPLPCRCIGPRAAKEQRAIWLCSRTERGALHIDMGSVPTNIVGVPLRDLEGNTVSALELTATGVTYPGGGIQYR